MKLIWACGTRTAGGFLINLTRALFGNDLRPISIISIGRRDLEDPKRAPALKEFIDRGRPWEYFERVGVVSIKIEDPGLDELLPKIAHHFKKANVLTTIRKIDDTITSHFNIKKWGSPESRILKSWREGINHFEALRDEGRLFVLNIDAQAWFNVNKMAAFLDCEVTKKAKYMADYWPIVNDLKYQKEKAGEAFHGVERPLDLDSLRERHPWITEIERRYDQVWRETSV